MKCTDNPHKLKYVNVSIQKCQNFMFNVYYKSLKWVDRPDVGAVLPAKS